MFENVYLVYTGPLFLKKIEICGIEFTCGQNQLQNKKI